LLQLRISHPSILQLYFFDAWNRGEFRYVCAIGSTNGFSTENLKRLHIDFATNVYCATNKKNYIKQMTKWLTHQEACHQFANYLWWTVPGYLAELGGLGYSITKEPVRPRTHVSSLVNDFGAAEFLPHLHTFLRTSPHTSCSVIAPTLNTQLPIYKCLMVRLPPAPQVTKLMTKDVICA
jgi:hypothetical protein